MTRGKNASGNSLEDNVASSELSANDITIIAKTSRIKMPVVIVFDYAFFVSFSVSILLMSSFLMCSI
jgi:hypothetical protein